jgi:xanthosine utilization system XapX-like protein
MRFMADGDVISDQWRVITLTGILGGIIGIIFDTALNATPLFTLIGVSGMIIGGWIMFLEWRRLVALNQAPLPVKPQEKPTDLGDFIPMPPKDERTYEYAAVNHWAKLDLVRACGDIDAVSEFLKLVAGNHELRVEFWKATRRVGREKFQHMRAELIRCGLVDNHGYKGAYQWTDEGRRWLASLPR